MEETQAQRPSPELRSIEGEYRRSVALVNWRPKILSAAYVAWGMFDVLLVTVFFLTVVLYIVSGSFADRRLMASLDNNLSTTNAIVQNRAPQDLVVSNTAVIRTGETSDAFVTISNANTDWYATFTLMPATDQAAAGQAQFINPGEERIYPLFALPDFTSRDRLQVTGVTWHHIDKHVIASPSEWLVAHSNVAIDNLRYARDVEVGTSKVSRVLFTLSNRTAYSYFEPKFVIRVLRGSTTIAITEVVVPELVAGEEREMDVRFFGDLPETATVTVEPAIFYFDPGAYTNTPEGQASVDVFQEL